jgi:hypothetical protein
MSAKREMNGKYYLLGRLKIGTKTHKASTPLLANSLCPTLPNYLPKKKITCPIKDL